MKKFLSVILAVAFSLSCFAATGFSQSDCGQACCCSANMQGLHHTTGLQAPLDSNFSAQTSAHRCGFAKNRKIELPAFTVSAGRINPGTSVGASFVYAVWSSVNDSILPHHWRQVAKLFKQSSPIFLQHRAFLI
jgi:hypothetical protein